MQQPYFPDSGSAPCASRFAVEIAAFVLFGSVALWFAEEIDSRLH